MPAEIFDGLAQAPDESIDLAEASLWIAREEYPDLDIAAYLHRLDGYAANLNGRLPRHAGVELKIQTLNRYLFEDLGFTGNAMDFYDPRNSFLNEVMDRKLGIPITISVIYIETARRIGLELAGVSFPGHFLVKLPVDEGVVVLDPFNGGITLGEMDLQRRLQQTYGHENTLAHTPLQSVLATASKKDIILRMLRNLKGVYIQRDEFAKALPIMHRIIQLVPDYADEYRDRGVVHQALECFRAAAIDYETYLRLKPNAPDSAIVGERVAELARHLSHLH